MRPIKIFLADLTHTGTCIATENIPLNIGLIGSFVKKELGKSVDVTLFKYPEKLLKALKTDKPHILGVSNYNWNSHLAEWACRRAKKLHPDILTVQGGWNFPLDEEERCNFLKKRNATDIYVINEGEVSFCKIVKTFLGSKRKGIFTTPISGCAYLLKEQQYPTLILGEILPRISNLDDIPSPYINGMLDEFFDGKLIPIIETTRGCPFSCTYCNNADKYYSNVKTFSDNYVLEELKYIAKKVKERGIDSLIIADTNFGMYTRDKKVAQYIAKLKETINWPQYISVTTGKNKIDRILDAVDCLKDLSTPFLSMQSMNPETQKIIKRSNMKLLPYQYIVKKAEENKLLPLAELIVPLPQETLKSYWKGIKDLINSGNFRIISYSLQLNYGTIFRQKKFMEDHGYRGQYRLVPNDFGVYDDELIFEPEMIATSSKYLSFNDYLQIRCFTFYLETIYNQLFGEFVKFILEIGLTRYDYMLSIRDEFHKASKSLQKIKESFLYDTKNELFETEDDLYNYYSIPTNYENLKKGNIGANVVFKHKALALSEHHEDVIDYITNCIFKLIEIKNKSNNIEIITMINSVNTYCKAKLNGLFNPNATETEINYNSEYDISAWINDNTGKKLIEFQNPTKAVFIFNEKQKRFRNDSFNRYGSSIPGKAKILARITVLQSLARVQKCN